VKVRGAWPLIAPVGVIALWSGLAIAEQRYPTDFDWRYMTMSTLLSPRDNPAGHRWAEVGIGLCGLGVLCWTLSSGRDSRSMPTTSQPDGRWALRLGGVCMVASGLLPLRLSGLPKGHELVTLLAFSGLCLGIVQRTLQRVVGQTADPSPTRRPRGAALLAGLAVAPIVLAGLAQLYVYYALPELHWVGLSWRARGVSVYLSFAFWEWLTCAVLSAHILILSLTGR
jgi:hypothetical protein